MDAVLQDFLGNKPSKETPKSEPQLADTQEQASEAVQETINAPMPEQTDEAPHVPSIEDRKPVFLSRSTRDALDRIVRMFGERRMSVSGLVENIARQHLAIYGEDIEAWRKL